MRRFEQFKARVLSNPVARVAYEDAQTRNHLVDRLIGLRRSKGITQRELAEQMGVTQPTVAGFETEGSDPRLSTLQRYARAVDSRLTFDLSPYDSEATSRAAQE